MRQLKILVDMDDTIEYLLDAWLACLNERYGMNVRYQDVTEWDLCKAFPTLTKEQIHAPLFEDDFWKTVKPMDKAADVLKWAIDEGHEVYIVTASAYQTIKSKMENVLFKYFPFITWDKVIIAYNKQMIRGDILIDDAPHNLENGECLRLLMSAGHNRNYNASEGGMIRVGSWSAIQACINVVAYQDEFRAAFAEWSGDTIGFMEQYGGIYLLPYQHILLEYLTGGTN